MPDTVIALDQRVVNGSKEVFNALAGRAAGSYTLAIWIRLPQVSSNTAVVTPPISSGS
jgi:hypothetical protein